MRKNAQWETCLGTKGKRETKTIKIIWRSQRLN